LRLLGVFGGLDEVIGVSGVLGFDLFDKLEISLFVFFFTGLILLEFIPFRLFELRLLLFGVVGVRFCNTEIVVVGIPFCTFSLSKLLALEVISLLLRVLYLLGVVSSVSSEISLSTS